MCDAHSSGVGCNLFALHLLLFSAIYVDTQQDDLIELRDKTFYQAGWVQTDWQGCAAFCVVAT